MEHWPEGIPRQQMVPSSGNKVLTVVSLQLLTHLNLFYLRHWIRLREAEPLLHMVSSLGCIETWWERWCWLTGDNGTRDKVVGPRIPAGPDRG